MIVRTYGRRNRAISSSCSDPLSDDVVQDPFAESLSQESSQDQICTLPFSSQGSSSHWSFDSDTFGSNSILPSSKVSLGDDAFNGVVARKSKKAKTNNSPGKKKETVVAKDTRTASIPTTSTLMEAQEFGEMMEHVDEVNFALDGLKKGQPVRIRRASLLSLLSICGTAQERRLLRTQGLAKTIVDAVLGLSLDDTPSNLAAATLFYILTCDGQDDNLLESPASVRFLIKFLRPIVSRVDEDKAPKIGLKLLSLRKNVEASKDTARRSDSCSAVVSSKVQEILISCKEIFPSAKNDSKIERPELCPKWLALLTMEKACLSSVSLDETTGAVRKSGGNFKEKFRVHGGLDAVFEVAMNCHTDMEGWMEGNSLQVEDANKKMNPKTLAILLKCLKIMENATFLSKDNQSHLLEMRRKPTPLAAPLSFTELVLTSIKILSDLYLRRNASVTSDDDKSCSPFPVAGQASELARITDSRDLGSLSIISSQESDGTERVFPSRNCNPERSQQLPISRLGKSLSLSEAASTSTSSSCSIRRGVNSSTSASYNGAAGSSLGKIQMICNSSRKHVGSSKDAPIEILDDSEDPFAFDEDDFEPSKWDLLSGKQNASQTKRFEAQLRELEEGIQSQAKCLEFEDPCQSETNMSYPESSNSEMNCHSVAAAGDCSSLIADCLLTAVKVLMNLTNDNSIGCQQIAAYGGLEIMSSLIAGHFPSFTSVTLSFTHIKDDSPSSGHQQLYELSDHELDFLVAILGLLVNLVEKDGQNRSRLAAASVSIPSSKEFQGEVKKDVIHLLCSIFLANQAGDGGTGEDKQFQWNDEAAVLQGAKEAEKMIVEAYAALLLAFLSTESKKVSEAIAECLPDGRLASLVPVLDRFVEFHLTLNMISPETHKVVSEVIESCRTQ